MAPNVHSLVSLHDDFIRKNKDDVNNNNVRVNKCSKQDMINIKRIRSLVQEQSLLNHAILAFVQLQLADYFDMARPLKVECVAFKAQCDPKNLGRLLRALEMTGLVESTDNGYFRLSEIGSYFRSDHPMSVLNYVKLVRSEEYDKVLRLLPDLVRQGGEDAWSTAFGRPFFAHAKANKGFGRVFNGAMTFLSRYQGEAVINEAEKRGLFRGFDHIVDIGGGHGSFAGLVKSVADATSRITVQDLTEVVASLRFLEATTSVRS